MESRSPWTGIQSRSISTIRRSPRRRYKRRSSCALAAAAFFRFCSAGPAGIAARSRHSTAMVRASARLSSAGMPAEASRSWPANISVSTATTAIRSSTSKTTMMTRDSSEGSFRGTEGRCGRLAPPSISRSGHSKECLKPHEPFANPVPTATRYGLRPSDSTSSLTLTGSARNPLVVVPPAP